MIRVSNYELQITNDNIVNTAVISREYYENKYEGGRLFFRQQQIVIRHLYFVIYLLSRSNKGVKKTV